MAQAIPVRVAKVAVKPTLTRKQKKFADEYLNTGEKAKSALIAYDTDDFAVAAVIANENLKKPNIQEYLADKSEDAVAMVYHLSQHSKQDFIKLAASKDILDRAGHKAVEKHLNVQVQIHADAKTLELAKHFEKQLDDTLDDETRTVKP